MDPQVYHQGSYPWQVRVGVRLGTPGGLPVSFPTSGSVCLWCALGSGVAAVSIVALLKPYEEDMPEPVL